MPIIRHTHRCKPAKPDMRPRRYRFELNPRDLDQDWTQDKWNEFCLRATGQNLPHMTPNHEWLCNVIFTYQEEFGISGMKIDRSSAWANGKSHDVYYITFTKRPRIGEKLRKVLKLP